MSKVVFVGNVPYNMGEDQLIDVFKSVGQVIGFRLVFDRETGKPRGYGFCEFADHETASSAVRNLNNVDVGGRPLRIDLADSDPFLEGKTTVRGELVDGGYPGPAEPRWRGGGGGRGHDGDFLSQLPPGVQVPAGTSVLDHISKTLATMPPNQLMEVLAQMKAFIITHPDHARQLLVKHPQLSYALFQGLLLNNIVDPAILQRMLEATAGPQATAAVPPPTPPRPPIPVPPPHLAQPPPFVAPPGQIPYQAPILGMPPPPSLPPASAMFPPATVPYYRPPLPSGTVQTPVPPVQAAPVQVPPAASQPPAAAAPGTTVAITETQKAMLMQVLNLTQEQINSLPETERNTIIQLRNQFGKLSS